MKMFDMDFYVKNNKGSKLLVEVYGVLNKGTERSLNIGSTKGLKVVLMDMVGVEIDNKKYVSYGRLYVGVDDNLCRALQSQKTGKYAIQAKGYIFLSKGVPFLINVASNGKKKVVDSVDYAKIDKNNIYFDMLYEAYLNGWVFKGIQDFKEKGYNLLGESLYKKVDEDKVKPFVETTDRIEARVTARNDMNLGIENKDDDSKINNVTPIVSVSNKTNRPASDIRLSLIDKQKEWDILEQELQNSLDKLNDFKEDVENIMTKDSNDMNNELDYLFDNIESSWSRKQGMYTGRMLFSMALEKVMVKHKKYIKNNIDLYGKDWLKVCKQRLYEDKGNKFNKNLWENRVRIYFSVLDILLGLRGRLLKAVDEINDVGTVFHLVHNDPYYLGLYYFDFHIEDLDKLAKFKGLDKKEEIRNALLCHMYMMSLEDTIVEYGKLSYEVKNGYSVMKSTYNEIIKHGYMVNEDKLDSLCYYFGCKNKNEFKMSKTGWKFDKGKYFLELRKVNAVEDYIKTGLGVRLDINGKRYVMDYTTAYKENYIINKVYELSKGYNEVKDEDIEKCIEEFELMKAKELGIDNFKLEENQKKAVYLIKNKVMCLTGPAGSGKTTTAEAILYACEKLLGLSSDEIMFCAPTGKAANRLKEVVKRKTSTINSLFRIGGKVNLFRDRKVEVRDDIKLLFVDESSMIDTDLMFQMLEKIDEDTMIYFLGDIEQLPPIGLGKPFANLLEVLPTVKLNVTKRASDKSGITKNANKIIKNEQGDLYKTDDFIIYDVEKEKVVDKILSICSSLKKEGYTEDDIQVISPLNKHEWGTKELNKKLQQVFNTEGDKKRFVEIEEYGGLITRFRVGDRVIHTKKNDYSMPRFEKSGKCMFTLMESSKGIMNGDVGKIEGIYKRSEIEIDGDEDFVDSFLGEEDDDRLFIAVKYTDFDTNSGHMFDFIVLYDAEIISQDNNMFKVKEGSIDYLDLAYALTVHKMQGSQSKVVIGVIYKVNGGNGFISRNLIYTLITRAQKLCYLVGDISGKSSSVNEGRLIEKSSQRQTLMDIVV